MEQFEVIFLDDDRVTVLDRQMVNEGEKVVYKGETPSKAPTNMMTYTFAGWIEEEKMEAVTERLILVAKYFSETITNSKDEAALLAASFENAKNTNLSATVEAGQKVSEQQKALEKDTRTPEEIVNEVLENGKAEIGIEANKDNIER
ncbi:MAG: hypothetical protein IKL55_03010 [Clostridia bacterium]|nr:hypothetical protein [Clostridia bacterium]